MTLFWTNLSPQSGNLEKGIQKCDAAEGASKIKPMGGTDSLEHINCLLGCESVHSFRTCLRRYCFRETNKTSVGASGQRSIAIQIRRGVDPSAFPSGTMMNYVSQSYYGWRGSMRVRTVPICRYLYQDESTPGIISVNQPFLTVISRVQSTTDSNITEQGNLSSWFVDDYWSGTQITTEPMSFATSIELPYYSNTRFSKTFEDERVLTYELATTVQVISGAGTSFTNVSDLHIACPGDDFGFFFFLGVPALWKQS